MIKPAVTVIVPLRQFRQEQERAYLGNALRASNGRIDSMAKLLGISLASAYRLVTRYDVQRNAIKQRRKCVPPKEVNLKRNDLDKMRPEMLLTFFGVEYVSRRVSGTFWDRHSGQLHLLYYDARKGYLAMVRKLHPDGNNAAADHERMALVNDAWRRLESLMRRHGVEC